MFEFFAGVHVCVHVCMPGALGMTDGCELQVGLGH